MSLTHRFSLKKNMSSVFVLEEDKDRVDLGERIILDSLAITQSLTMSNSVKKVSGLI